MALRGMFQLLLTVYVTCSVLFTTCHLFWGRDVPQVWPTLGDKPLRFHRDSNEPSHPLFLSKAFSHSLQPSQILPFYFRATGRLNHHDVTITTLITNNRFQVFSQLVERYQGPISVTVHIKNDTHAPESLQQLQHMYSSSFLMSRYVDVHLVIDSFDRQFNLWRNIARFFARTEFVMMLDVDFVPCTPLGRAFKTNETARRLLEQGRTAFVVPALEYLDYAEGKDASQFPTTKEALIELVNARRIDMFHASWPAGHNSTDYDRFYASEPGDIYPTTQYHPAYEPYVIFKKEGPPWCDERFVGYGGNKAACLFEMYISGVDFHVLSDHFLIHQHHRYEEMVRRPERKYNRKVFSDFKEQVCLRYLRSFHETGTLDSAEATHVRQECSQVNSIVRAARELLGVTL